MKQFDIFYWKPPNWQDAHPVVVVSHPDRASLKPRVEVIGCTTQRAQRHAAVFSISPVALVIGFLPQRQQRLVEAWAELHTTELLADWQLLEQGRKPAPISPLQ